MHRANWNILTCPRKSMRSLISGVMVAKKVYSVVRSNNIRTMICNQRFISFLSDFVFGSMFCVSLSRQGSGFYSRFIWMNFPHAHILFQQCSKVHQCSVVSHDINCKSSHLKWPTYWTDQPVIADISKSTQKSTPFTVMLHSSNLLPWTMAFWLLV